MKDRLYNSNATEIRKSSPSRMGYGVFAKRDIEKAEIIEECYFISLISTWEKVDEVLKDYVFSVRQGDPVAVLGSGMIYNHSNKDYNVCYRSDKENKIFIFKAVKDISKDEELFIDYDEGSYAQQRIEKGLV